MALTPVNPWRLPGSSEMGVLLVLAVTTCLVSLTWHSISLHPQSRLLRTLVARLQTWPENAPYILTKANTEEVSAETRRIVADPHVSRVNCRRAWDGDTTEVTKAKRMTKARQRPGTSLRQYERLTRNCSSYRQHGGFRTIASVAEEELSFPLAFNILVYKDVEQAERLVRAIYRPHNVYCIHIDAKSDRVFRRKLTLISRCLPNVFLSDTSVNVTWGTFSTLEAELTCMRQLMTQRVAWRYLINLTGQEFPLKTNRELVQILKAFKGANDISGKTWKDEHRWEQFLPAPYNLTIHKGSVHIAVSRAFVDYVLSSRVSQELQDWVKPVPISDEIFFNTLDHNPQLGAPGSLSEHMNFSHSDSFTRYKVWSFQKYLPCGGRFVREICHLGVEDLQRLTTSSQMFANKFSYNYQPLAYDCLEEWLFWKIRREEEGRAVSLNLSLYESSVLTRLRYDGPVKVW
ncbi:beta-1,3-galactosyl-O-glycosyl-glycoprotein beta-1,6-N-acetylglucosaminyltransferase-like isoform X2 [Littorina saxatilis]|uniref:beta-1,3-galactosyl-O-glycosyl-glycoprotein beta-1,6-N-acetylglucosaminyltransferase-like isoform X2 n=1 Tax=Littorina saxatilis TaxID=31220 RepID=UPI0038B4CE97